MKPLHSIICLLVVVLVGLTACSRKASELSDAELTKAFEQATEELVCFNFPASYQLFSDLLASLPAEHPLYFKTTYGKATCAQHITPPTHAMLNEAITLFEQIVNQCKDEQLVGRSMINLGRIAELRDYPGDEIDLVKARDYYTKVVERYASSELADEAILWTAGTYIQVVADRDSKLHGVEMLEKWLKDRPDNAFASPMWTYLAQTYQLELMDLSNALNCYLMADKIGLPVDSQVSMIYWRMATIAEKVPNALQTSVNYYQKIIRITPTSGRAFESQLALERLSKAHPEMKIQVPQIKLYQIGE
jgi:tetratricopeptide (TPR) repeat protein